MVNTKSLFDLDRDSNSLSLGLSLASIQSHPPRPHLLALPILLCFVLPLLSPILITRKDWSA